MKERDWVGSDVLEFLKPHVKQTARTRRAQQSSLDDLMRMLYPAPESESESPADAEVNSNGQVKLMQVVRLLRAEREAQGLSLADVHDATGITRGRLSRIENRHEPNPTIGTLHRIAEALGMELVVSLVEPGGAKYLAEACPLSAANGK